MSFDIFDSIILGLIQGLTEFLPISSSGHLVVMKNILNVTEIPLVFDVFFHFATLLSICTVFRKDILNILKACVKVLKNMYKPGELIKAISKDNETKFVYYIFIATIPAVIFGLTFKDKIETLFTSTTAVAIAFLATGIILLSTKLLSNKDEKLNTSKSIIIGVFQAAALFPGISRSGTTITSGMWLGIKPEEAVKFSFFLAIPAILGANILEFSGITLNFLRQEIVLLLAGGLAAYFSGLIAIKLVLKVIQTGRFFLFGIYCISIGIITFIWI
ncbi:MAG: undecaprenyl-diphosphate phosphatase [bacterium]|nr:undecaprenyl-diphosphate phosphatase [bacterium]